MGLKEVADQSPYPELPADDPPFEAVWWRCEPMDPVDDEFILPSPTEWWEWLLLGFVVGIIEEPPEETEEPVELEDKGGNLLYGESRWWLLDAEWVRFDDGAMAVIGGDWEFSGLWPNPEFGGPPMILLGWWWWLLWCWDEEWVRGPELLRFGVLLFKLFVVGLEEELGAVDFNFLDFVPLPLEDFSIWVCCFCCWRHLARRFLNHTYVHHLNKKHKHLYYEGIINTLKS